MAQGEVDGASADEEEAEDEAVGEADAVLGHGAVGGAGHTAVGGALEGLVEGAGAGGDEGDAEEGFEEAEAGRARCPEASEPR